MVNIQSSGNVVTEEAFESAYVKRTEKRKDEAAAKAYKQTPKTSYQDWKGEGATVTISAESQEFMAGVEERKAAQRAEKEALLKEQSDNPFAYSGNIFTLYSLDTGERVSQEPTQWRVFSKELYKNGFYDNMSDEEVLKTEDMLKRMTSVVESIYGLTDIDRHDSGMSHEAAKLEFISSLNALNYFADAYVPEEMRDSFKSLIKAYENYNRESVDKHENKDNLYYEWSKNLPAPNAVNVSESVRKSQERTRASQEIGRVTHTAQEDAQLKEDYQAIFDNFIYGNDKSRSIYGNLMDTLVNYASGGSKNSVVVDLLSSRNDSSVRNVAEYWAMLLK